VSRFPKFASIRSDLWANFGLAALECERLIPQLFRPHPCGAATTAATQVRLPVTPRAVCHDCVPISVPPFAVSVPV